METSRFFTMPFATVYPLYLRKAEKKGRTKAEVDAIIFWLTGYDEPSLRRQIEQQVSFETFFGQAPRIHPNAALIKGVICGCRVEEIKDELLWKIRCLDKLIDELAKGKALQKILRE